MGQRPSFPREFKPEARVAFAFLVEREGFAEPEDIDHGLMFRREDPAVRLWFLGGREAVVATWLMPVAPGGRQLLGAWLEDVRTAAG